MNLDFRDGSIYAINIYAISHSIQNLTNEIEDMAKNIHKASPENQKWLTDIINEFNTQLRIWIDRHTDELETIEAEIRSTDSNTSSEKAVLELTYKRLDAHRRVFERI
jgi:gas vesicle protein